MDRNTGSGLSFAKRLYLPRCIGLGIGFFCVAAALWGRGLSPWVWALLLFNGYLWPHLAYQWARRSAQPYRTERRNLLIDSLFGGFWAGAMQFNVLPSVTILAMLAMNNIAAGGGRLFLAGCLAQLVGALLAMLVFATFFDPHTEMRELYAWLPMLMSPGLQISLSIGLAGYSPLQLSATDWLADADQALYQAKSAGRNRIVMVVDSPRLAVGSAE